MSGTMAELTTIYRSVYEHISYAILHLQIKRKQFFTSLGKNFHLTCHEVIRV